MSQNTLVFYGLGLIAALATAGTRALAASSDLFAGQQQITAAQLVASVLTRNPGLKAQQAAAQAAVYRIAPASALDDPTLSYSAMPATLGGSRGLDQQLELSQPLPWPGKLALREQAAQEKARAVAESKENLRLQVAAAAKTLFAEWFYVHRALAINRKHQELLKELRHIAEHHYAAGRTGQQDALQAAMARARLEAGMITLERQRREVQARINALLSRPPPASLPLPAGLPEPAPLPPPARIQAAALHAHPELARLRARIAEAKARTGLAEKDFYPDFRIMAGYNNMWPDADMHWTLGFSINLPFDYGNKRSAALDAARATLLQTRWQLTDREAQLLSELAASRAAVKEAEKTVEIYTHRLVPLAQANLEAAQADYRAGAGPFSNVINAERQQLRTRNTLVRARADYLRRLAALERWVGAPLAGLPGPASAPARDVQPGKETLP